MKKVQKVAPLLVVLDLLGVAIICRWEQNPREDEQKLDWSHLNSTVKIDFFLACLPGYKSYRRLQTRPNNSIQPNNLLPSGIVRLPFVKAPDDDRCIVADDPPTKSMSPTNVSFITSRYSLTTNPARTLVGFKTRTYCGPFSLYVLYSSDCSAMK